MEALKKFALNATTASLAERERLFDDLFNLLDKQSVVQAADVAGEKTATAGDDHEKADSSSTQIPELGYKLLGKMMYYLFPVYIDKQSKQYLIELNNYLIRFSVDNALRPILASLEWHSKLALSNTSNRGIANQSLYGIDILNGLLTSLLKHHPGKLAAESNNDDDFNKLTLVYSNFVLAASIVQDKRIDNSVTKKLKQIVSRVNNLSQMFAKSIRQVPVQENELVYNRFMFCYCLLRVLPGDSAEIGELKSFLINHYIDSLIGSRDKPKLWLVKGASKWLSSCTRDEFNSKLLPDIKRSLLRNPEIVLESVGILFENLNIDLSDFSSDLAKSLGSQLVSKDESIQADAAQVFKSLAEQCSSNDAILALIKFLFAILNGTESSTGKLTTQTQKCTVLTALGNLAYNSSPQISQEIIQQLVQSFGEYLLKSETHEATVIHALGQFNVWLGLLKLGSSSTMPADTLKKLNEFFKSFLVDSSKQTTFQTRSGAIRLLVTLSTSMPSLIPSLLQNTPVVTACVQVVEKAAAASTGQVASQNYALASEALTASLLLSIFLTNDIGNESKLGQFLTKIAGGDKSPTVFTSEKFILSLNEASLVDYCQLFEKLIELDVSHKDGRLNLSAYQTSFVYPLLHSNYKVRKQAQLVLKRLFKWIPARLLVSFLSDSFEQGLRGFGANVDGGASGSNDTTTTSATIKWPSSKGVCEAMLTFASSPNLRQDEIEAIATKSLVLCNLTEARVWDKNLYEKCLSKLLSENKSQLVSEYNSNDLIQSQTDAFLKLTLQNDALSEKELSSIETLAKLDGKNYLPRVIAYALDLLSQNSGRLLTVTRQEHELISVQDADLPYDKSLVEQVTKQLQDAQDAKQANLRRENKTYSYKEQMADLELKKEIEAKKKKAESGGGVQQKPAFSIDQLRAQMSKKQQEQLDAQIERERRVRDEMRRLDAVVVKASEILKRAVRGNSGQAKLYLSQIVRSFVKLTKSPLCASRVLELMTEIVSHEYSESASGGGGISSSTFYTSILYCFMRLVDAPIHIDSRWTEEPLHDAFSRILTRLNNEIRADCKSGDLDLSKSSFFYPFLKFCAQHASLDEKSMKSILELVGSFSSHRNHLQHVIITHHLGVADATLRQFYISNNLKQIVDNFLSTEYISLLLGLIVRSAEQKLSLNVQYLANEALNKGLFQFNHQFLFVLLGQVDKEQFVTLFNNDIAQLNNYMSSSIFYAREACLQSLRVLINEKTSSLGGCKKILVDNLDGVVYEELVHMLVLACYDSEESNRKQASDLWTWGQFESSEALCLQLADDITHPSENVRVSAAEALAHLVKSKHTSIVAQVLDGLLSKYVKLKELPEPKKDQFGRVTEAPIDEWESREGIASTLQQLAECIPSDSVSKVFKFFVIEPSALNDRNSIVRNRMLDASIACLNYHGRTHINDLLPLFEQFLQEAPKEAAYDSVRQNIVILMGTLAKHLDKDDARVAPIIGKLVQALQTPSQQVQEAVSNCLPPLMPSIKSQVPTYVNQLMNLLLSAPTYGERRGAAYGLAGMLKGVGMLSLRQLNVLQRLNDAVNNKQDAKQREGALIAYELLTIMFNKVFEPYSVEVLPSLLLCFGDPDANVRQAAEECSKAIMANLTFTGVKMILPKLLERLGDEESWRTKCGSVELLGAMAHCAPKQLSTCLPSIVPNLIEVLSDSHVKVQKAGTQALRQIGSVIKNPEILNITGVLLEALQDPANKTQRALQVLLETKFVHFIDAPSLALIMPVVQRAFQDRSTEIRKMAAQIMGNMYSLTDQKDLLPYLPSILPGLKASLLDPVPDVRTVSSKALGSMIRVIGENGLNEILSWLMERLVSEQSSVDRSGAAQGLSEVFGALGVAKLEQAMPEIIERAAQVDLSPFVRDGYIMMFIYLPLTFGDEFIPYVGLIIQPVLKALADDSEFVRDTAIKAGQRIVNTYADTAISLFLPELEKGLFDINWRIRYSSVQLLGDLLYKISGVVGKMTTESAHEDDNFGTEKGSVAIISALGEDRRNRIYSGLYMGRSDTSLQVRQASLHVWKVIVSNTPRTLKEILPTLFNILLSCLASVNADRRQIAAGTLVDIVRKLGERILPDIIPILEHGLKSGERSEQRQGVCIGLSEIMANISKDNVMAFSDSLVPTVRLALMDPLVEVRAAGARTFDNLHAMIGLKALEEVVLFLYNEMRQYQQSGDTVMAERALDGLKQLMLVKSRACLPFLVPYLTQPPVDIQSLCALCSCANIEILGRHLNKILNTLVQALAISYNKAAEGDEATAVSNDQWINDCELLLVSVQDPDGIRSIVHDLLQQITEPKSSTSTKLASLDMLNWFCSKTEADYSAHVDDLVKNMLNLFVEKNDKILLKAWTCLNSCIDTLKGIALIQRLPVIRQTLRLLTQFHFSNQSLEYYSHTMCESSSEVIKSYKLYLLPGFCIPKKGLTCLLPIFKEGLLNGPPDVKEQSALTLCECIKLADGESLKPSVMNITGPLIRVLGERYNWSIKSAILDAIYFLLLKVDITLKPFLPQLQPTFMKNLVDANRVVRIKSGCALAKLLLLSPRLDTLVLEIMNNLLKSTTNPPDQATKETLINSLRLCFNNVGGKLQEDTKSQLLQYLLSDACLYHPTEYSIRAVSAGAVGSLLTHLSEASLSQTLGDMLNFEKYGPSAGKTGWIYIHSNCMSLSAAIKQYSSVLFKRADLLPKLSSFVQHCANHDRAPVCQSAIRAITFILDHYVRENKPIDSVFSPLPDLLVRCVNMSSSSAELKELSIQLLIYITTRNVNDEKSIEDETLLRAFVSMLINGTRERSPSIRLSSEVALVRLLKLAPPSKAAASGKQINLESSIYQKCLELLSAMRDSVEDCVRSLSKESLSHSINLNDYNIDETLLKLD